MSSSEQNKSEQATPYKLEQARKKGMVARSQELGLVASFAACGLYLSVWGADMAARLSGRFARAFAGAGALGSNANALTHETVALALDTARAIAPLIGIAMGAALVAAVAQMGLLFAPKALKIDWSKLNPAQGFKRIFSMQMLIEALKACIKIVVYTAIVYWAIRDTVVSAIHAGMSAADLARAFLHESLRLLGRLLLAAVVFAAIDQFLVRRTFAKRMRMSRYEQKQEFKQREGDPRIKQRRKQLQRELLQRAQSMRNVRGADVLVTNPTHYAVGLRYDTATMSAPQVVAKGSGEFAQRLKKLAFIYGVPVLESKTLARKLHRHGAVERDIPGTMYRDVAAIYLKIQQHPAHSAARA